MKKSNIVILGAFLMAICWSILIGWFAASAINNYQQGKDPYFARSHSQYLESKKKSFPVPVSELCISGDGVAILKIIQGKQLAILSDPRTWSCVQSNLKNGRSMISLKRLSENGYNEPVTLMLPGVPSLSLDNFSEVDLTGVNQENITITCTRVRSFSSNSCKIGTLSLDFPGKKDHQDIYINKSNQFNCFIASVQGFGKIGLETAGINNQISLSDSMKVEATYALIKKLYNGTEPHVLKNR